MGKDSAIEWTDHTFNPWIGCTEVSPGCVNCYAAALDEKRFSKTLDGASKDAPVSHWGKGAPRHRTSAANWKAPLAWDRDWKERNTTLITADRPRVFCASLADWLDDEVPVEWLADLLGLIHATPNLDWLLLTKRPQNWLARICRAFEFTGQDEAHFTAHKHAHLLLEGWISEGTALRVPKNIWIGSTAEDEARADARIPELLKIPAQVHFLSCEPLLGPLDLDGYLGGWSGAGAARDLPGVLGDALRLLPDFAGIDWVICGGESGTKEQTVRAMRPEWARSLRDQCQAAGVPFFFKQWGDINEAGARVGKQTAGKLLDGARHLAFPATR